MAVDYLTTDTELTSIANAIRTKGGTSSSLVYPTGFVSAIEDIPTGTDVSDTTATESDVLSGKYFHKADGTKVQGSIATKTSSNVTVSDNVVTIPAGYYASQVQKTVGTAQAAQTITPTTTDQTIASGKYLTGTQTIKGDANLVAGNIKNGTTIFGVTGTYSGGGGGSIKRIAGSGNTTVYPTGWSSSDFGTGSIPGESNVINANDPKFLVAHVTIGNVVRTFAASYMSPTNIVFDGSIRAEYSVSSFLASITQTGGYITSISFPETIDGMTVYDWEIISNLPVRSAPQSGTFYIDYNGEQAEYNFDGDTPTWVEWVQSEYNDIGLDDDGNGYLTVDGSYLCYDEYAETPVEVNDAITANTTYYLI